MVGTVVVVVLLRHPIHRVEAGAHHHVGSGILAGDGVATHVHWIGLVVSREC